MASNASVRSNASNALQAALDDSSRLTHVLEEMKADIRKTTLETKINDGDDLATPLIIAARDGKLDSVRVLLRYEANIEARGSIKAEGKVWEGCTALWTAVTNGHLEVVRLLIEQNPDVDGRLSRNATPLTSAAFYGRLDVVQCLVENGADVNARNSVNSTPLMVTCYNGHMDVVSFLVENGANIHLEDNYGQNCLHYAAGRGHVQIVDKLLALGAKQTHNLKRLTPLLKASNQCKTEMVEHFISRPECTKEQIVDALELLGATIANYGDAYAIEEAFSYMKRGMVERYKDPSCLLLKKKMEPVEAYQNRKESQT
ncbi:Protein fem-1-like B, partial [Stylophora pistillata]